MRQKRAGGRKIVQQTKPLPREITEEDRKNFSDVFGMNALKNLRPQNGVFGALMLVIHDAGQKQAAIQVMRGLYDGLCNPIELTGTSVSYTTMPQSYYNEAAEHHALQDNAARVYLQQLKHQKLGA